MTLRSRLIVISVLMLGLPVAGWQVVKSLEQALRDSYQQTLIDTAAAAAGELSIGNDALPGPDALYVHRADRVLQVDGFADDWTAWLEHAQTLTNGDDGTRFELSVAERRNRLRLLIRALDDELVLSGPDRPPGDRIEIGFETANGTDRVRIAPVAPGWLSFKSGDGAVRGQAALQPGERTWTLELRIDEPTSVDAMALRLIDVDLDGSVATQTESSETTMRPLARPSPELSQRFAALLPRQTRGWVTGPDGWVAGRAGRDFESVSPSDGSERDGVLATATARLLGIVAERSPQRSGEIARLEPAALTGAPAARWFQLPAGDGFVISASAPIRDNDAIVGHVIIERPADRFMTRAYRALLQLFVFGVAGMLLMAGILVGFAGRLSNRIRRLRNAVDSAVSADGRVHGSVAASEGGDEIADLARSVSGMVTRQREHQDYLRTLSGKLSHELRTPLAMIRSSLDNLAEVDDEASRARYRQRAEAGCQRLQETFQAMSQAARIEESLSDEAMTRLDLGALVERYVAGIGQTFVSHRFAAVVPAEGTAFIDGAADQLAQLLDKLVDNAVSFAPDGSRIVLRVVPMHRNLALQVDNPGSRLPDIEADRLFESMTAARAEEGDGLHLGLGLFVVRMIAQRHGGRVRAMNRGDGVRFQVEFPRRMPRVGQELP